MNKNEAVRSDMVQRVAGFLERRPKKRLDNYLAWSKAFDQILLHNNESYLVRVFRFFFRTKMGNKHEFSREELFSILEEALFEAFESVRGKALTNEEKDMIRGRVESLKRLLPDEPVLNS